MKHFHIGMSYIISVQLIFNKTEHITCSCGRRWSRGRSAMCLFTRRLRTKARILDSRIAALLANPRLIFATQLLPYPYPRGPVARPYGNGYVGAMVVMRRHRRGSGGSQLAAQVGERLHDEIAELEESSDLMLELLQRHQGLGLLADEVVERPGRLAKLQAVHAGAHWLTALE